MYRACFLNQYSDELQFFAVSLMLVPRMISRQFDELQAVRNRVRIKRIQGIPAAGLVAISVVAVAASNS